MKVYNSAVTSKGQVTIPREVRERLGLSKSDRVAFVIENSTVRLERGNNSFSSLAGMVAHLEDQRDLDFERVIEDVREAEAEDIVREIGGK